MSQSPTNFQASRVAGAHARDTIETRTFPKTMHDVHHVTDEHAEIGIAQCEELSRKGSEAGELKNIKRVAPTLVRKPPCYHNRLSRTSVGVPSTRGYSNIHFSGTTDDSPSRKCRAELQRQSMARSTSLAVTGFLCM